MNNTFSETLINGLNNPECSFYVGATIGQYLVLRIIGGLVIAYFILKLFNELIFTPLLNWAYKKIYKKINTKGKRKSEGVRIRP